MRVSLRLGLLTLLAAPLAVWAGTPEPEPDHPASLDPWVRPFHVARYARSSQFDALPRDVGRYKLTRRYVRGEPARSMIEECEQRLDRHHPADCVLLFLGREGFGNAASPDKTGLDWWSPPQVILPPEPAAGVRWTSTHQKRGATSTRSCELRADRTFCDDGLESRCITDFDSHTRGDGVVLAEHYCPGLGWVGEDALAHPDGAHTFRTFTYDLVVDGVRMPERRAPAEPPKPPGTVPGSGRGA